MSANDVSLKEYFGERLDRFEKSLDRVEKALTAHQIETRESMKELERKVDLWTWRGISASCGALLALGLAGWNAFTQRK